jgi:hypothetical protein
MPNYVPTTSYGWIVSDLSDVARDLDRIQQYTDESITEVEAALAYYHLKHVLDSLILATRISRAGSQQCSVHTMPERHGVTTVTELYAVHYSLRTAYLQI